jgi:hypothetical protein
MRAFLLFPCLLSTLALSSPGQKPEHAAALAGVWEGTQAIESTGRCGLDTRVPARVKVEISVDGDGRLHARLRFTQVANTMWPGTESSAPMPVPPVVRRDQPEWIGLVRDNRVEFELPQTGHCQGTQTPNNYVVKLEGPLSLTDKGLRQMRLTGDDRPCPTVGCTFRRSISLTRKRALP